MQGRREELIETKGIRRRGGIGGNEMRKKGNEDKSNSAEKKLMRDGLKESEK